MFKLRIPGRDEYETQPPAISAIPLFQGDPNSGIAGIATQTVCESEQEALIAVALRVCDLYGDNEAAREEMRLDVLATEPHLMPDLLEYLRASWPAAP